MATFGGSDRGFAREFGAMEILTEPDDEGVVPAERTTDYAMLALPPRPDPDGKASDLRLTPPPNRSIQATPPERRSVESTRSRATICPNQA
jgi:hypothetical protein